MFAYLDTSSDVIAVSSTGLTLSEAQALNPDITTVISDAPFGLVAKGSETFVQPYHHRLTSGDGSDISHYTEIEVLRPLKIYRANEIDDRTQEIIEEGFVASNSKRFRIDNDAMITYNILFQTRNSPSADYPVIVNVFTDDGIQILSNSAAVEQFVSEMFLGRRVIFDAGVALKQQIIDASTVSEIDAVVDNR